MRSTTDLSLNYLTSLINEINIDMLHQYIPFICKIDCGITAILNFEEIKRTI